MKYCALLGDIEWFEDALINELTDALCKMAEGSEKITFIALPMCVYNSRVTEALSNVKNRYPASVFVLCTNRYTDDYISPGEPFETIIIPADINKIEDYYPYMCKWAIDKSESAVIYVSKTTLEGRNHLSVNALKLAEYAKNSDKNLIMVKPELIKAEPQTEKEEIDYDELFSFTEDSI